MDEDTITISVEAARAAMARRVINPADIGAVYVGSESHPYAVKPTAVTVGEAIGATPVMTAADYEFACKAGTAAIQTSMGLVKSGMVTYSVAVGADVAQGEPGDNTRIAPLQQRSRVYHRKRLTSREANQTSSLPLPWGLAL